MKVDGVKAQSIYDSYSRDTQRSRSRTEDDSGIKGDKLELSGKANELKDAKMLAQKSLAADGDRSAKIGRIKKMIDSGTYSVPSSSVAKSVMKGLFFDKKA